MKQTDRGLLTDWYNANFGYPYDDDDRDAGIRHSE